MNIEYPENLAYLQDKQIELLKYVRSKKVVYLDMNHWNWLRRVHVNGSNNPDELELYNIILSSRGKIIFPIELNIFLETLKQADPLSFSKTIEIMDILSDGIAIIPYDERQFVECWMFFGNPVKAKDPNFIKEYPVFTKASLINGSKLPVVKECGKDWNSVVQRTFIDYIWELKLGKMHELAEFNKDGSASMKIPRFDDLAETVNKFNEKYSDVYSSWEGLIDIEIQGAIDVGKKFLDYGLAYLH